MFTCSLLDAPRRLVEVHVLSPLAVMPGYQKRGCLTMWEGVPESQAFSPLRRSR